MTLPRVAGAAERLDAPQHDPGTLEESLHHVAAVNRRLGGTRALLRHLPELLPPQGLVDVLDAGTGSADLPRAISDFAREARRPMRFVALDLHPQILAIARRSSTGYPEIRFARGDVRRLPFADGSFDVVLLGMTLHHLEGEEQVRALQELWRVSRRGILVGELRRSRLNYAGARVLAGTIWRGNPLTRHDGPLSVLRAFTADELLELAGAAGLGRPRVHRHFFQRLVLTAER